MRAHRRDRADGRRSLARGPGNLTVDTVRTRDFGAHLSGPGNINVGSVEASGITLNLSGPGDIHVAGHADRAVMHLSGPGNIHAGALNLGDADMTLSGPGDIDATVTRTANVQPVGSGRRPYPRRRALLDPEERPRRRPLRLI